MLIFELQQKQMRKCYILFNAAMPRDIEEGFAAASANTDVSQSCVRALGEL